MYHTRFPYCIYSLGASLWVWLAMDCFSWVWIILQGISWIICREFFGSLVYFKLERGIVEVFGTVFGYALLGLLLGDSYGACLHWVAYTL